MTETQKIALEDLDCIVIHAQELIQRIKNDEIDNIEEQTMEIYRLISQLNS